MVFESSSFGIHTLSAAVNQQGICYEGSLNLGHLLILLCQSALLSHELLVEDVVCVIVFICLRGVCCTYNTFYNFSHLQK